MTNINQTQQPTFKDNWTFQLGFYDTITTILKDNASYFVNVSVATQEQDFKQATDFVVKLDGGDIAVRIRRKYQHYRDLTIRSKNGTYKTELSKIKEGWARYYLYCWQGQDEKIDEWMLVDMNKVRLSNLLDNRVDKVNKDGRTAFIAIPYYELIKCGCILVSKVNI